jgi:hypothetical protein
MVTGSIEEFTGLLVHPRSTLASLQQAPFESAFIHFLFVWDVFATLFCLVGSQLNLFHKTVDTGYPVLFVVMVLAGWLFFGLVVHAALRIMSGPKSIQKTCKAIMYAATPLAVIGWIPLIGGLSFVWGLLLIRWGIGEFHEISGRTAISVMFLSLLIGIPIFVTAYFFLLFATGLIIH